MSRLLIGTAAGDLLKCMNLDMGCTTTWVDLTREESVASEFDIFRRFYGYGNSVVRDLVNEPEASRERSLETVSKVRSRCGLYRRHDQDDQHRVTAPQMPPLSSC
jgi:hypothetical protein